MLLESIIHLTVLSQLIRYSPERSRDGCYCSRQSQPPHASSSFCFLCLGFARSLSFLLDLSKIKVASAREKWMVSSG